MHGFARTKVYRVCFFLSHIDFSSLLCRICLIRFPISTFVLRFCIMSYVNNISMGHNVRQFQKYSLALSHGFYTDSFIRWDGEKCITSRIKTSSYTQVYMIRQCSKKTMHLCKLHIYNQYTVHLIITYISIVIIMAKVLF